MAVRREVFQMQKRVYADTAGYLPLSVFDGALYNRLNVLGIHRYLSVLSAYYRIFFLLLLFL